MIRGYNFGAGPATLPESILQEAQAELLNWQQSGMSILEIGHRTELFKDLLNQAELLLRELLSIPNNYHVLFLTSPARTQFAMIPMNLIGRSEQAGYLISGVWSKLAYEEACQLSHAYCIADNVNSDYWQLPVYGLEDIRDETAYVYYTSNETIQGLRFPESLTDIHVPLVVDMTSSILSEPIAVDDYGLIFAGAQKNIGPAGLTIVIMREDLLKEPLHPLPTMLNYQTFIDTQSLYATPATFQCYMAYKMFQWVKSQGGVDTLYQNNIKKAKKLYDYIDASSAYQCHIAKNARSLMNVCFSLIDPTQEEAFLKQANQRGLYALKGHRLVGGLRASLYNAMPMAGVEALITFMQDFSVGRGDD